MSCRKNAALKSTEELEIDLLLEGIFRRYGLDFRQYTRSYLRRRLKHRARMENVQTLTGLLDKVLHSEGYIDILIDDLSINVTAMFRDPDFFISLRREVAPYLRQFNTIRIWQAGCSTGEEVYSLAILLHEEELLEKAKIYATDMNPCWLESAKQGFAPLSRMREYTHNYLQSGGTQPFSYYYRVDGKKAVFHSELFRNVHFFQHNLATDGSFHEFDLILCRNVLIYFNPKLQQRVFGLFCDSLKEGGFLALGRQETLDFSGVLSCFTTVSRSERLYRKRIR